MPFCGFSDALTQHSYSGLIDVRVQGVGENTPGQPLTDAFYELILGNPGAPSSANPLAFRLARASQSECTCLGFAECDPNVAIETLMVDPYPLFRSDHDYTVRLYLGAGPAERLVLGFADCGCSDNSGTFAVEVQTVP